MHTNTRRLTFARHIRPASLATLAVLYSIASISSVARAATPDSSMSIPEVLQAQSNGSITCVAIAKHSLAETHRLNLSLKAFISVNPNLLADAAKLAALRHGGTVLPLHCVTIAVKDNINVAGISSVRSVAMSRISRNGSRGVQEGRIPESHVLNSTWG